MRRVQTFRGIRDPRGASHTMQSERHAHKHKLMLAAATALTARHRPARRQWAAAWGG